MTGRVDGRSRPRAATDRTITAAVVELLAEGGSAAVTMDAVAARSGVAKTTLYRRYADRRALLAGAAEGFAPLPPLAWSPTGPVWRSCCAPARSG